MAETKEQDNSADGASGVLRPATLALIADKRKAIKVDTDESFRQTRAKAKAKRDAYSAGRAAQGKVVKPRVQNVPLPGEDIEDMRARLKSERNAADYQKRLARQPKTRKNVSRAAMTPEQVKAHEAKLKREKRAAAKAQKAVVNPLASNPIFGMF